MKTRVALEAIRKKYDLPALAATTVVSGKPTEVFTVGVRRYGATDPALPTDAFHLGSDTKAMTATLIGVLMDQGKLTPQTTLSQLFPEQQKTTWRNITVEQLLQHKAGLTALEPAGKDIIYLDKLSGPIQKIRLRYLKERLATPPDATLGKFEYSNAGYTILGIIAERVSGGTDYETLLAKLVFAPLGMTNFGFGPPPKLVQHFPGKPPVPLPPNALQDNPALMAPAGRANMPLGDWAKFIAAHATEDQKLLKPATWKYLHTPPAGGDYTSGWICTPRPWANGLALTHSGSNTMNFATTWLAPKRGLGVLVATNVGGDEATRACNEVIGLLLTPLIR
jgi:CubicO group peptidase (beta-lactamase class C family)